MEKICDKCDFEVEQLDIEGKPIKVCLITNKEITKGCIDFKNKTGNHISM